VEEVTKAVNLLVKRVSFEWPVVPSALEFQQQIGYSFKRDELIGRDAAAVVDEF
jgi:hypothetical protein